MRLRSTYPREETMRSAHGSIRHQKPQPTRITGVRRLLHRVVKSSLGRAESGFAGIAVFAPNLRQSGGPPIRAVRAMRTAPLA